MSSPCLLRAAPISQPRLRDVKLSLKTGSRDTASVRSSTGSKEAASRPHAPAEKEAPVRAGMSIGRSRSTPPVHRAQRAESRKAVRAEGRSSRKPEPEQQPERNGSLLQVPAAVAPAGLSPLSSSSSSTCTPRRQRGPAPQPPPGLPRSSSSSSSSTTTSTAKSMKRARWLSYSTSNICFNSILEGRFRQLQGT